MLIKSTLVERVGQGGGDGADGGTVAKEVVSHGVLGVLVLGDRSDTLAMVTARKSAPAAPPWLLAPTDDGEVAALFEVTRAVPLRRQLLCASTINEVASKCEQWDFVRACSDPQGPFNI